jgi:glycosyltransferase involved in cell wall biosynthesis
MPRVSGIPVALNVDGIERRRKKWSALGRAWYRAGERFATLFPNTIITDAENIAQYYRERYGSESECIPYGAEVGPAPGTDELTRLGLEPGRYLLYVSRMEPENNALLVRECFERLDTDLKLALIGDAPYAQDYIARVRNTRDPRVIIPGAIYGQGYRELQSHCFAYVHATEVGGTHPALIEAMGRGALTLYLDTPENAEVAAGAAIPFTHDNLAECLRAVLGMSEFERSRWRQRAMDRVSNRYSWNAVTDAYENLLLRLVK